MGELQETPAVLPEEEPLGTCCSSTADGMQAVLPSPSLPTKPPSVKQGPQVFAVVEQGKRFSLKQFDAREQLTEFRTELMVEMACFILSALPAASVS